MKRFCLGVIFCVCLFLTGCSATETGLADFAKPYLGNYTCKEAKLGDKDLLPDYDFLHMELKADGTYCYTVRHKDGTKDSYSGRYSFDEERKEITLILPLCGRKEKQTFQTKDGELLFVRQFGDRVMLMRFTFD